MSLQSDTNNDIFIIPSQSLMQFSGSDANPIVLYVEPSGSVNFVGTTGSILKIMDNLSGSLFSVNNISGLPILEVFSNNIVNIGNPTNYALIVSESNVIITGSLVDKSTGVKFLVVDTTTGVVHTTGSGGGGGSPTTPGGSPTQIQYNSASAFGGVPTLTYDGTILKATGSFTGSFTGSLFGTSSWAVSSSQAITASYVNISSSNIDTLEISYATPGVIALLAKTGSGAPGGSTNQLQFNSGGVFGGVNNSAYNSGNGQLILGNVIATGSFTGSFTGSLLGTASFSISASQAISSSFSTTASYVNIVAGPRIQAIGYNGPIISITGSIGGSDTHIQFNSGSAFSGSVDLSYRYANNGFQQGSGVIATGSFSHAQGSSTLASGTGSHTEGSLTTASGNFSHAEGTSTRATQTSAHAEGNNTLASGTGSHAEGQSVTASGNYSHAEGDRTRATGTFSHAEGSQTWAFANFSHAEGADVTASGIQSHAEGRATFTSGNYAHTEGYGSRAFGDNSHAEGFFTITGDVSQPTTFGRYSHAEGYQATASGESSHAEGFQTKALGEYSHAEGRNSIASGSYSHAEGWLTVASGASSHAEGYQTRTMGDYSHAEGFQTLVDSTGSHAEGFNTTASGDYQLVIGQYNIASTVTASFIIGNGTSVSTRRNLIFTSGSQFQISGSLFISGAAESGGSNQVLTYNSTTGLVTYTASNAIGGGGSGSTTPGGSNTQIQYNNSNTFDGVPVLTYDGTTLQATGSFTGSLTGSLFGTATTASYVNLVAGPRIQAINYNGPIISITGSIGGSDTHIQFNSGSAFSGSGRFTFDYINNTARLTGSLLVTGSTTLTGSFNVYNSADTFFTPKIIHDRLTTGGATNPYMSLSLVDGLGVSGSVLELQVLSKGTTVNTYFAGGINIAAYPQPGITTSGRPIKFINSILGTPDASSFEWHYRNTLNIDGTTKKMTLDVPSGVLSNSGSITTSGSLTIASGSINTSNDCAIYFGASGSTGSWRIAPSGTNLVIQKWNGSAYSGGTTITP